MAKRKTTAGEKSTAAADEHVAAEGYTVLARRYRPQQFQDLVGQEPVARALINALDSNRVAHAYLFTGARGVGKTSTARILAKALNCERGPTTTPCDQCDMCRSIASGEDVDVLEIDGASNRGIDEVRELRRNVQYHPARARYKVYIIDEVHMLTKEAFNALLKTLEEPPGHVKFIFATTEVQKIPVTILSRCQRFDFAGIGSARIVERLKEVVAAEKMQADDEALEWIARRAAGSMRDAQSLLDQLLAFGGSDKETQRLTIDQVHRLLGTAHDDRVVALAGAVLDHDARKALELLDQAGAEGLQLGELLDQLLEYWRDLMIVNCAGLEGREVSVSSKYRETMGKQAKALSVDTIMSGLDVLSTTKSRMRNSSHGRVLFEMALIRLARLEDLVSLTQLAQMVSGAPGRVAERPAASSSGGPKTLAAPAPARTAVSLPEGAEKKKVDADGSAVIVELTAESLPKFWQQVLTQLGPMMAGMLDKASSLAISGPNTLVLNFSSQYNSNRDYCQEPSRTTRIADALKKLTGRSWNVRFDAIAGEAPAAVAAQAEPDSGVSRYRRQREDAGKEPLVKRAMEQLGAQIVQVDEGFGSVPAEVSEAAPDEISEQVEEP